MMLQLQEVMRWQIVRLFISYFVFLFLNRRFSSSFVRAQRLWIQVYGNTLRPIHARNNARAVSSWCIMLCSNNTCKYDRDCKRSEIKKAPDCCIQRDVTWLNIVVVGWAHNVSCKMTVEPEARNPRGSRLSVRTRGFEVISCVSTRIKFWSST